MKEVVSLSITCGAFSGSLSPASQATNGSGKWSGNENLPSSGEYPGSCTIYATGPSGTARTGFFIVCNSLNKTNSTCASLVIGKVGLRFSTGPALTGTVNGISIQPVQLAGAPRGSTPFKVVYASQNHRALYSLPGAPLYRYTPATGAWSRVSHITGSGIYATRGAHTTSSASAKYAASAPAQTSGSGSTNTAVLLGLGALVLLAFGGFAAFRVRKTS